MKDQSQPPPRAECDACAKPFIDGTRYHLELSSFPDLRDTGADICKACNVGPSYLEVVELIRARRRSLQLAQKFYGTQPSKLPEALPPGSRTMGGHVYERGAKLDPDIGWYECSTRYSAYPNQIDWSTVPLHPTPPAKHEFRVGDYVQIICDSADKGRNGTIVAMHGRVISQIDLDGGGSNIGFHPDMLRLIRPAASAQPESQVELCGCGKPASEPDPHMDGDCPLEFCASCYLDEVERLKKEQPSRDPYADHLVALSKKLGLSIERDPKVIEEHVTYQTTCLNLKREPTKAERLRAQHLADLDRPIRKFGILGDRDKYGQKLSLRGWTTDEE